MDDDMQCTVYKGSAVDEWAIEDHNFHFDDPERCPDSAYMTVTKDDAYPPVRVCKTHGESWLGNEKNARIDKILVATPEEVAAAIASIKEVRPRT